MPLSAKTTIVHAGDPTTAADAVLSNHNAIKMIVIINDASLAQTADDLAQNPPVAERLVIWFPGGLPATYQALFSIESPETAIAFSLKLDSTVADIIRTADQPVDYVRMDQSYFKAGL